MVALWFLVLDVIAGHPLRTPSVLGQVLLFGVDTPVTDRPLLGAVCAYTAVHFLAFLLFGVGLAALVRWASTEPVVRYALLQVFLVFEVFFYGILLMYSEETRQLFPFWTVLVGNTLAALAMGAYLWSVHPGLRAMLKETPLGAAPMR